jgi:2-phosphoglycerate kinase
MSLDHVFWLGGSACSGKSSVARLVAAELGLTLYACDDHFEEHRRRADPARHPWFHRLMDAPMEELWAQPAAVQADELLRFYQDEFEMVFEDLAALPGPVLAEGVGLLPERVAAVCPDPRQAVWLIATPDFRRRIYPERGPFVRDLLSRCADTEQVFSRWMERDDRIAGRLAGDARRLGLEVITVEGGQSLQETARRVAERFR